MALPKRDREGGGVYISIGAILLVILIVLLIIFVF
jgi:hypothetical protein